MVKWVWQWLRDHRVQVEVNGERSDERVFRAGLPQGSVLSPFLFLLWAAPRHYPKNRSGLLALHVCRRHGHPLRLHPASRRSEAERRAPPTNRFPGQGVEDDRPRDDDASQHPVPVGPRHGGPLHQGSWIRSDGSRDAQPVRCLAESPPSLRSPLAATEGAHPPASGTYGA